MVHSSPASCTDEKIKQSWQILLVRTELSKALDMSDSFMPFTSRSPTWFTSRSVISLVFFLLQYNGRSPSCCTSHALQYQPNFGIANLILASPYGVSVLGTISHLLLFIHSFPVFELSHMISVWPHWFPVVSTVCLEYWGDISGQ